MPGRILITEGTTAGCTQTGRLIEGVDAEYLLADRGYIVMRLLTKHTLREWLQLFPLEKTEKTNVSI